MPELRLVSLICHRTDDTGEVDDQIFDLTVEDEPYLLVDRKKVWGVRRMKPKDVEDLSGVEPISFEDSVSIELWDRDAGYFPDDDQLGRITIQAFQEGLGEISHVFKRRSAKYTLTYKVE